MKTILVPTDFSENANSAVKYAINLAEKIKAKIVLMHAFNITYPSAYVPVNIIENIIKEAELNHLERLINLYNKTTNNSSIPVEFVCIQDEAIDSILKAANEKKVDFIVMGTLGASHSLSKQLFGTNSLKIIEKATCPVITIPDNNVIGNIKTIAYSTNYLNSDIECLQTITEIAKCFNAKIKVIHISQTDEDKNKTENDMASFKSEVLKQIKYESNDFITLRGDNIEQRLEQFVSEGDNIDLLVMSAHNRSFTDKIFGKSVTKVMALYLKTPLMVFHHNKHGLEGTTDYVVEKLIL